MLFNRHGAPLSPLRRHAQSRLGPPSAGIVGSIHPSMPSQPPRPASACFISHTCSAFYMRRRPATCCRPTWYSVIILAGTILCSNASHAWNDFVDAPLDALVSRTRMHPVPRGDISRGAAVMFVLFNALAAIVRQAVVNKGPEGTVRIGSKTVAQGLNR